MLRQSAALACLVIVTASTCTPNLNFPNGDLPRMPVVIPGQWLANSTAEAVCASMCAVEPACLISVTQDGGCDESADGRAVCYLKGTTVPSTQQACTCGAPVSRASYPAPQRGEQLFAIATTTLTATFDGRGLLSVSVSSIAPTVRIESDSFALALDGVVVNSSALAQPAASQPDAHSVQFVYSAPPYAITVLYEAHDGWAFLRKTLSVTSSATPAIWVSSVSPFDVLALTFPSAPVGSVYPTGDLGTYGVFVRFADGSGMVAAATNPMLYPSFTPAFSATGGIVHVGYHPSIVWNQTTPYDATRRPFVADSGLLGFHTLGPNSVPPAIEENRDARRFRETHAYIGAERAAHATDTYAGMRFEYVAHGNGRVALPVGLHLHHGQPAHPSWLNYAERDAYRQLGEAHFLLPHKGAVRVHIPWTENDYQIDISNATQWPEYARILEMLSRIGVERILYAGANTQVSAVSDCTDDWCWEDVLWLGYGEKLRKGEWVPGAPLADTVAQLINVSQALGVSAIPYVYPILGFTANRTEAAWLTPRGGGKYYSDLSNREFQDYFIDTTVAFGEKMKSSGAGYDYTYFYYGGASLYSQFHGWRRMLGEVRLRRGTADQLPYVVDNRQASHQWSPWMWAVGSYAEPLQSDEQTTSWLAYLQDIHIDRTDGNRQREMNYDYAQSKLCQPSAMPGFAHHNTDRFDVRRVDLNIRDFDFYGASFTIISAIATGGVNMVINGIPARDLGEFAAFPQTAPDVRTVSVDFYRSWFAWAESHKRYLLNTKFLPVPPAPGVIDGTYAMVDGAGFIFLFNPNAEAMSTPPGLLTASAASLDTTCKLGDSLAVSEVWPFPSDGALFLVACGANFTVELDGRSARVLALGPALADRRLALPRPTPVFRHNQPVTGMAHNASFAGGRLTGTVRVPQAAFDQLAARAAAYPVPWTADDLAVAWMNPSRLLVSIDVNRAVDSKANITATLDGGSIPVLPCWSCRSGKQERCFQGFFVDLSAAGVRPDTDHALVVTLPSMAPGAFGGVYYDNVDTIY